jgi:hypothetical protein
MAEAEDVSAPWVTLSEAASQTGRHVDAIRSLVRRRRLPARKGNGGQWLVQIPASEAQPDLGHDTAGDTSTAELLSEVTELREALAEARAEAKAARDIAEARVDAARAEAIAVRELADRLTAELKEARKSWWRRMFGP